MSVYMSLACRPSVRSCSISNEQRPTTTCSAKMSSSVNENASKNGDKTPEQVQPETGASGVSFNDAGSSNKYFGYKMFHERRSEDQGDGKDMLQKVKCQHKVYNCIQKSPLVKLMLSALKSAGCEVDIGSQLNCESCEFPVVGGYDPEFNQIVICQNNARREGLIQGVLTHELIHMFDYCRAKMDFKNLKHLACTEIRAANLTHCSFMSSMIAGHSSPINIAKSHAECVKHKAAASIVAVREVSVEEALSIVDSVFDKCYNDLEPIGRRVRRNSEEPDRCYFERHHYGYGA